MRPRRNRHGDMTGETEGITKHREETRTDQKSTTINTNSESLENDVFRN